MTLQEQLTAIEAALQEAHRILYGNIKQAHDWFFNACEQLTAALALLPGLRDEVDTLEMQIAAIEDLPDAEAIPLMLDQMRQIHAAEATAAAQVALIEQLKENRHASPNLFYSIADKLIRAVLQPRNGPETLDQLIAENDTIQDKD